MPTLNIKAPDVYDLVHQLAALEHTSATNAVREAVAEKLERSRSTRTGRFEAIMAIAAEYDPAHDAFLSDDDLYDKDGLPR